MINYIIIHVKSGSRHFPCRVHVYNRDLDKTSYFFMFVLFGFSGTPQLFVKAIEIMIVFKEVSHVFNACMIHFGSIVSIAAIEVRLIT